MGGAKRKGIAQAEKAQKLKEESVGKKKTKSPVEKKATTIILPKLGDKDLVRELEKLKAITPNAVASTYSIRVSAAKDFLKQLEKEHIISLVGGCRRLRVYKPIIAPA